MLLPLKQGLKHSCSTPHLFSRACCYATSIKTRIETIRSLKDERTFNCCYATSIKTRIETTGWVYDRKTKNGVVMLLPLKQGLKPIW